VIPVELLWAVVVLAAALIIAVVWIEQRRIDEERETSKGLRERVRVDEELLEELRGPRKAPEWDDVRRAA